MTYPELPIEYTAKLSRNRIKSEDLRRQLTRLYRQLHDTETVHALLIEEKYKVHYANVDFFDAPDLLMELTGDAEAFPAAQTRLDEWISSIDPHFAGAALRLDGNKMPAARIALAQDEEPGETLLHNIRCFVELVRGDDACVVFDIKERTNGKDRQIYLAVDAKNPNMAEAIDNVDLERINYEYGSYKLKMPLRLKGALGYIGRNYWDASKSDYELTPV